MIRLSIALLFVAIAFFSLGAVVDRRILNRDDVDRVTHATGSFDEDPASRSRTACDVLNSFQSLRRGMTRNAVLSIMGEPDYTPNEGKVYYYGADAHCSSETAETPPFSCTILVEFFADGDSPTELVDSVSFGPVGE